MEHDFLSVLQTRIEELSPLTDEFVSCSYCNIRDKFFPDSSSVLKRCKRCKTVMYCRKSCQVKDWKRHKSNCKTKKQKIDYRQSLSLLSTNVIVLQTCLHHLGILPLCQIILAYYLLSSEDLEKKTLTPERTKGVHLYLLGKEGNGRSKLGILL